MAKVAIVSGEQVTCPECDRVNGVYNETCSWCGWDNIYAKTINSLPRESRASLIEKLGAITANQNLEEQRSLRWQPKMIAQDPQPAVVGIQY